MPLLIKGFLPITLIDWPGKIASLLFTPSCNFRCPYCYNIDLVLHPEKLPNIGHEKIFKHLLKNKNWLDGVIFTGGEPTIWKKDLILFCQKIKSLGFLTGIETNGTNPKVLEELIKKKLVDYIALDIKGPLEKYEKITKVKVDINKIKESVLLIKKAKRIEKEFRTTVVPGLIDKKDIEKIGKWLKGSEKNCKVAYFIQQFRPGKTLDPKYKNKKPYKKEGLEEMKNLASKYFQKVGIRGV